MLNFLGALGFLTRIRVPDKALARPLNATAQYFPAVGIVVGLIVAAVYELASFVLPTWPAIVLSTAVGALVTGGFHEDGLSDSADGLGGGWTKEDVLRIMQDSRVGSFGALALVLVLVLKLSTLVSLPVHWIAVSMVAAHAISRFIATTFTYTHEYVRFEGKNKPLADGISVKQLTVAGIFALIPLLFFPWQIWLISFVSIAAVRTYIGYRIRIRIGGYTGDLLGMSQQLTEVTFYLAVCSWFFIS